MGAKVVRWQTLLGSAERSGLPMLTRTLLIGYLLNTILPGCVGELAPAGLVARHTRTELGHALSSIVVEKVLDILTSLVLAAVLSLVVPLPEWLARVGQASSLVALLSSVLLVTAVGLRRWLYPFAERLTVEMVLCSTSG